MLLLVYNEFKWVFYKLIDKHLNEVKKITVIT